MLKEERFRIILEQVNKEGKVLFPELSSVLRVSEDTVRRDIKELSEQGLLYAVRGGAIPHSPVPHTFKERIGYANEKKELIAHKAISFLENGQVIILDGGTSTLLIAANMPKDLQLTVITNSFPIVTILEEHENIEVLFAGGRLMKSSFVTVGNDTTRFIEKFRPDICFLGICSIHDQLGVTGPDYEESTVKHTMVHCSKEVIALATIEKLDTAEAYYICPTTQLDKIITDQHEDIDIFSKYKALSIAIV